MIHGGDSEYLADEVDLGNEIFAEVLYFYSYEVDTETDDINILSIDKMDFRKIIGPNNEDLSTKEGEEVPREYKLAAQNEFWRVYIRSVENDVERKITMGEISLDDRGF